MMERDEFSAGTPRDDRGPCRAHDCGKESLSWGIRSGDTLFERSLSCESSWIRDENGREFYLILEHRCFIDCFRNNKMLNFTIILLDW